MSENYFQGLREGSGALYEVMLLPQYETADARAEEQGRLLIVNILKDQIGIDSVDLEFGT